MPNIKIGQTTIDFPNTGRDPTWSDSIIQFAEAVAVQLSLTSSNYDVAPTVTTLENDNPSGEVLATFDSGNVIGFNVFYTIYRKSTTTNCSETGTICGLYNGSGWVIQREFEGSRDSTTGTSFHSFSITAQGELKLTYPEITTGTYDTESRISYYAKSIIAESVT